MTLVVKFLTLSHSYYTVPVIIKYVAIRIETYSEKQIQMLSREIHYTESTIHYFTQKSPFER